MTLPSAMEDELREEELEVPSGVIKEIIIEISTEADKEKLSVLAINAVGEVTDPRLGFPNPTSQCSTCGAKNFKHCEGHFGVIKFPYTIVHPYFLSEVTKVLNRICPGCKSIRKDVLVKGSGLLSKVQQPEGCKYCTSSNKNRKKENSVGWYPRMKFKVSSKDLSGKAAIIVEIDENLPKKFQKKGLADDYWNFIPKDAHQEENNPKSNRMVLTHYQVRRLLRDVDQQLIEKFITRKDSLFLTCFSITPNSHRVTEITRALSNGKQLIFDQRTRAYRKLVDFRGKSNELSYLVHHCLKISKLHLEKSATKDPVDDQRKKNIDVSNSSGSRWIKDVVLGKRNDRCFRMVVTGDPNIKLSEIGIPCHIAEKLQISEHLNTWNWERLSACSNLCLLDKGMFMIRRKGNLVRLHRIDALQLGDIIYRPLSDGDIILVNRPPSTHPHSLIALSVKILPISSVVTINPLCCSPFHGDFDGDCLHGYIPQSVDARVELNELVALDRQLTNEQSGRNLLSFSQDSLIAAHLVMEDGILLSHLQMQQLQMFYPQRLLSPAIVKNPLLKCGVWTGKQLFSMLLPPDFEYIFPAKGLYISKGEVITSEGCNWLRDNDVNLFQSLIKHCPDKVLDILFAAQEVLCEWLSMRGLSVSLSDLYLSSDSYSHKIMMDEIFYGLQEAQHTSDFRQLMVDSHKDFLISAEDGEDVDFQVERLCYEKQRSAALSQASFDAFKQVFWDIQNLAYKYSSKENSLLAMFKAGSKGNLLKLVQHSMCLGLQHSLVPLSFRFPHKLSCAAWNSLRAADAAECAKSYIPYAVVENSFLTGLNPLECFVHSVTSRNCSFSDNADLPGTLTRRLMFFMRDLYTSYDGTVRNAYGNQLVQFTYSVDDSASTSFDGIGGQPVGSLSACAISEAAYSALDKPISLLETSPLLNLKNILECGSKKSSAVQTMSLYLSKNLGKKRHGFEYGALEVKNHLECRIFSDIVSTVMIIYSPQTRGKTPSSPWICHFHVCKERLRRTRLKVHSIIDSLNKHCNSARISKINLPKFHISSADCSSDSMEREYDDTICITVTEAENSKKSFMQLETIRNFIIPFLLKTVVKGFLEIKKVDILWKDTPQPSKSQYGSFGELCLRVTMSRDSSRVNLWSLLINDCTQMMDMIDWTRSHPDNIHNFCLAYGIDAGLKFFLNNLESAVSDTGKSILPKHLLLVANTLSATGEFVGLNAKGTARQREHASISSPFMQACFSNPGACLIKAAKAGVVDKLEGTIDALAWGQVPSVGTSGHFDVIYSGKGHKLSEPLDVYNLLGNPVSSIGNLEVALRNAQGRTSGECGAQFAKIGAALSKDFKEFEIRLRNSWTVNDIRKYSREWKNILHKYPVDQSLSEKDKSTLMTALLFHPRGNEKIGTGAKEIKVTCHPEYQNTKCFSLVRTDGTSEDFSYHKCVVGALEIIAPRKAKSYQSKWLKDGKA